MKNKKVFLITAPSGAGKSTFLSHCLKNIESLKDIVTYTTRDPRPHETHKKDYHFIDSPEFEQKIEEDFFV